MSLFAAAPISAKDEVSIRDRVYTADQAERGKAVYSTPCGWCHGRRLNGAADDPDSLSTPPLAGEKFLRNWNGRTLATLYFYTRETMPSSNPGSLTDQEYIDVIAYMLSMSGMPAGEEELSTDPENLENVYIRR